MTVGQLKAIAAKHEDTLRNFRLSGKLSDLIPFIHDILDEDKKDQPNLYEYKTDETDKERAALSAIIEEIGEEGTLSIVKLVQKVNISRPVFNSLMNKLEKYNIALVKNQGAKGTYIRFLNSIEDLPLTKEELYGEK